MRSYRWTSRKSLVATSGTEYQPEKAVAGKWTPPASSSMPDTAGSANHCSPSPPISSSLNRATFSLH